MFTYVKNIIIFPPNCKTPKLPQVNREKGHLLALCAKQDAQFNTDINSFNYQDHFMMKEVLIFSVSK